MAIYGYHTGRTYVFIGPHICTQYVSITVSWKSIIVAAINHIKTIRYKHPDINTIFDYINKNTASNINKNAIENFNSQVTK